MKKIIPILFIISLLLLVGCKTKSDQCDLNNDSKVDADKPIKASNKLKANAAMESAIILKDKKEYAQKIVKSL